MTRFHTIVVHERPHLDEIVAIWLLRKFGEDKFPGVSTAKLDFWGTGGETPDGRSVEEYGKEGFLLVGIGGGRFDEHPFFGSERKNSDCATTLVAKELEIDDDPAFKKILEFVLNNDLKGANQPFDIASLIKLLYQQHPETPEIVINWAITGLEAKYHEQLQFWTVTKEEFTKVAKVEEVIGPGGRTLRVVTVVSDDEQISKFARSPHGARAAIVIQKRSSGNVQIYTNRQYGLLLHDVAQMIRLGEQKAKGKLVTTDWKTLASEGKVDGVEEWFYHHEGQMLLNGSLTAKDVHPTRLSLEQIKEFVRIGINPNLFEPKRAKKCQEGVCISTRQSSCPWFNWGLHRCRKIRFEMKQK